MSELDVFRITTPSNSPTPLVLSFPHSGINFPTSMQSEFCSEQIQSPEDTDWFVDELYKFALDLGATCIKANYSRYVIDLNRDPAGKNLYQDNRIETSLLPSRTFSGKNLYQNQNPSSNELESRLTTYYWPYYQAVEKLLTKTKQIFGHAIFFDCHSISRLVPSINKNPFPDLILGTQNGKTAAPRLCETALRELAKSNYSISDNNPFKGGHLTRYFGNPESGIHALQLEMSKDIYMSENPPEFAPDKANRLRPYLKQMLLSLVDVVRVV